MAMQTAELIRKVRRIEIITRRMVNDVMAGEYHSVFKGKGIEFEEAREYQPGDDVRSIDWNVTARMGAPFVKRYVEERELTVVCAVDGSASCLFGTGENTKNDIAAELCALLGFSAIKNNDRVGLLVFTDRVEKFIPPKKGSKHVLAVIQEMLAFRPSSCGTNINAALEHLNRVLKHRCVVFLLSDFIDEGYEKAMAVANRRHDLVAVVLGDRWEQQMANAGMIAVQDAETGAQRLIDTGNARVRQRYLFLVEKRRAALARLFKLHAIDFVKLQTRVQQDESANVKRVDYATPLVRLFRERARRL